MMQHKEFNRRIIELAAIIGDGIAYFTAWRGLMVKDDDTAQALNRYRGFFLPARNAMRASSLMQIAKIFDKDERTISLRNLLIAAQNNPIELTPHITNEDLTYIENKIEENESILEDIKLIRDQRLAHWDSIVTNDSELLIDNIKKLLEDVNSMYNILMGISHFNSQ